MNIDPAPSGSIGGSLRFIIPNLLTGANMLCGYLSIISATQGQLTTAAWLILVAGIFDLIDGRVARLLNGSSSFGAQFDTLSDQLSFGLAPAYLIFRVAGQADTNLIAGFSFLYALAVSFRLARFTVAAKNPAGDVFSGLSSPVAAATLATFIVFLGRGGAGAASDHAGLVLICGGLLAVLMVSRLRFPAFKQLRLRETSGRFVIGIFVLGIAVNAFAPSVLLFPSFAIFIVGVLIWNLSQLTQLIPTGIQE